MKAADSILLLICHRKLPALQIRCSLVKCNFSFARMRICTSVTEHEVARAKNLLKTNILMQLDGMWLFDNHNTMLFPLSLLSRVHVVFSLFCYFFILLL